jgi:hypothetical protein
VSPPSWRLLHLVVSKTDAGKGAAVERIRYWPCILGHEMNNR